MSGFEYNSDRFDDLASAEALGVLSSAEKGEFHALLAMAPLADRHQWQEYRHAASQLHLIPSAEQPPRNLWSAIRYEVQARLDAKKSRKSSSFTDSLIDKVIHLLGLHRPNIALAISVVKLALIVVLGVWTSQLQIKQTDSERELTLLRSEVDYQRELLAILQAPRIDVVNMAGTETHPAGSGKVITDPMHRQAILQIANLPMVGEQRVYQHWVIVGDQPISAGVFAVRESDDVFFRIEDLAETDMSRISAFAVTEEPKGGMPNPTGPMVLLGAVQH